jgi:GntR family transcriptional regulator, transcriptional repressor for pyruvate dehydrogenase complex
VREATQSLAAGGYLEIRRGRAGGAFVLRSWGPSSAAAVRRTLDAGWDDLQALFDLRTLIESLIARTAAQRHLKADVAPICEAHADYVAAQDRGASHAADQALHTAIAAATQNPYLVQTSLQLRARASLGFLAEAYSERLREIALDHHAALVAAILDRRADDAARIATAHFGLTERALRDVLNRAHAEAPGPDDLSSDD